MASTRRRSSAWAETHRAIVGAVPGGPPGRRCCPCCTWCSREDGYVSPRRDRVLRAELGLTTAEVSAVATFYTQYKRHPNGDYTVGVCINTLCAVMGGDAIWEELSDHLGVGHDETTDDGAITLERVECNAACDYAPVVMVNWEFFDNQTPAAAPAAVDALRAGKAGRPDARRVERLLVQGDVPRAGRFRRRAGGRGRRRRRADAARHASWPASEGWMAPPLPGEEPPAAAMRAPRKRATAGSGAAAPSAGPAPARAPRTPRTRAASQPAPGTEQSSAERPVTPADTAPETVEHRSDAKETDGRVPRHPWRRRRARARDPYARAQQALGRRPLVVHAHLPRQRGLPPACGPRSS